MSHTPVLLEEIIKYVEPERRRNIVDATLNGGGHTLGILEKYPDVKILGIELDPDIFQKFQTQPIAKKIIAVNDSYVNLKTICKEHDFKPNAILLDLGLSSWHYDSGRGFTFKKEEMLDMRFNSAYGQPVSEIVNTYSKESLERIIAEYGEEKFADQIASAIQDERRKKPILTTGELVKVIESAVPHWYKNQKIHPATKTFQALRIEANDELENVRLGVTAAIDLLNPGSRLLVISFQGLEDKIVRELFKTAVRAGKCEWVVRGTIRPNWSEVKDNPRSRSAKLKIVQIL